jgi:hypothetical protein
MTNNVHLIAVPADATGRAKAIGRVHNDYARWLPIRRRESGHLWQNRFFSCPGGCLHLGGACLCGAKSSACWNGCALRRMGVEYELKSRSYETGELKRLRELTAVMNVGSAGRRDTPRWKHGCG